MADLLSRQRKYTAFWAVMLLATCLLMFDKLTGEMFVDLLVWTVGLYMGGNAAEHWSKRYE